MEYTVHGILQDRILERIAFPFSRGSFQPRDRTQVPHIADEFFIKTITNEDFLYKWQLPLQKAKFLLCFQSVSGVICKNNYLKLFFRPKRWWHIVVHFSSWDRLHWEGDIKEKIQKLVWYLEEEQGSLTCSCFCEDQAKDRNRCSPHQSEVRLCNFFFFSSPVHIDVSMVKNLSVSAGDTGDSSLIPGLRKTLEKEMATDSSILAWEIPGTEKPGGLQSIRSQKNWTWCSN